MFIELTTEMKQSVLTASGEKLAKTASKMDVDTLFEASMKQWKEEVLPTLTDEDLKDEIQSLRRIIEQYPESKQFHGYFISMYELALQERASK